VLQEDQMLMDTKPFRPGQTTNFQSV